jgi:hypothetical protein
MKDDKKNMTNYRLISLLTSFFDIFEKVVYERPLQHIETNNILVEEQFAFRPSASTDKAWRHLLCLRESF